MIGEGRSFSGRERNCCFLNTAGAPLAHGRFANISSISGLDHSDDGRAIATVDWDHDGDLDLWISNRNAPRLRFMRNDTPTGNHFVSLRLVGNGRTTNRDAIGARVEVRMRNELNSELGMRNAASRGKNSAFRTPHSALIKTLRAGEGFLAQSSKWLHFGLGPATNIEKVVVRWPGSEPREELVEEFTLPEADRRYELVQGTGQARQVTSQSRPFEIEPSVPALPPPSDEARIRPYVLLPAPPLNYLGPDGRRRVMPSGSGKAVLINFWSPSCGPCVKELAEFARQAERIRAAGIEILALNVDGLSNEGAEPTAGQQLLSRIGFPFPAGQPTEQLSGDFQKLHDDLIPLHRALPLPTSLLIDRRGRLTVIYKGSISVDALLEDAGYRSEDPLERFARSAALAGNVIPHNALTKAKQAGEADIRFRFGQRMEQSGFMEEAVAQYREVLSFSPDSFEAHHHLGLVLAKQDKLSKGKEHLQRSLRLKPDDDALLSNLGNVFYLEKDFARARAHYRQVLGLKPGDVDTYIRIGNTFFAEGNHAAAKTHYEDALRIDPDNHEAQANLARLRIHREGE